VGKAVTGADDFAIIPKSKLHELAAPLSARGEASTLFAALNQSLVHRFRETNHSRGSPDHLISLANAGAIAISRAQSETRLRNALR
jgi:hypothetical protein